MKRVCHLNKKYSKITEHFTIICVKLITLINIVKRFDSFNQIYW